MSEIGSVSSSYSTQVEAPSAPTTVQSSSTVGPDFDTGTTQRTGINPDGAPPLRAELPGTYDQGRAKQMAAIGQSLDAAYALLAAETLKEANDSARVAKAIRVQEREAAYQQDLAAVAEQRESAMYGVIGNSTGAAGQAASAGINMAGGAKGLQMTSNNSATAATQATSGLDAGADAAATAGTGASGAAATTGIGTSGAVDSLGSAADIAPDMPPPDVDFSPTPQGTEASAAQAAQGTDKAAQTGNLATLDSVKSQQLSARAQNLSLFTQGLSQLTGAAGESGKGAFKYVADIKEAEAAQERAEANKSRAMLETQKEHVDKLQNYIESAIRTQDEIQSNKNQTERSIWSHV
ncbi:MAG: hypothetical protein OXJ53_13610 [Gammaproteobacteria bacterium]|nr:hypothetical protein [Gammaproteobacteria bacterium]MDE0273944.1 hypothetical protein [Gammaproteobacteria bacterium]